MTAISSLLLSTAAMPPPVSAGAATPSLASFLDLLAPVTADLMPGKRQVDAAPGKTLPVEDGAANGSEDALAWLGVAAAPAAAMIAPVETPVPGADGSGAQASGSDAPAAGMTRVGTVPPSPVEPLVAPPAMPLPGSDGVASMTPGALTSYASVASGIAGSLPSSTVSAMQQAPVPAGGNASNNAAVPERSARRIGDAPSSGEPLVTHMAHPAVGTGAMTTPPPANEGEASLASVARIPPESSSAGTGLSLSSAVAFTTQQAPASAVRDPSSNLAGHERSVGRASITAPGTSVVDLAAAGQIGEQAISREPFAASVVTSIAGADANAVAAALTSQIPTVQHRFAQLIGVQTRVGIDLPNTPAVAPIAVALPGVLGTAVATPVAGTTTVEVPFAPAQVSAIGSPVRLAGEAIVSDPGQPALSPGAPAAIDTSAVVGERLSVAAPIVTPDKGLSSRFLPAGVLTTGTPVEARAPGTAAPAALVFADAIHHALGERDSRATTEPAAALTPVAPALPGVAATGAAQGALDLRHEHWPAAMIERIASLRDMAAENDTRLRLSPDMLGTIDVSLRRDGDQVQVQITAEQAQTRQLLADAQPRLAELADARGVKLHLTGGQAGGGGQPGGDAPRHHAAPATNPRPRNAHGHAAADDTDQRIA